MYTNKDSIEETSLKIVILNFFLKNLIKKINFQNINNESNNKDEILMIENLN